MSKLTFKDTVLSTKYALLAGLSMPGENQVSVKIDGIHGEGKTACAHAIAKDLGGECLVVEGGSLKEGELTGLPFANTTSSGKKEVNFVPYYQIAAIQRLEEDVYNRAKTEGLMGGTVVLDAQTGETKYKVNASDKNWKVVPARSRASMILEGEQNQFKFGEDLPYEIKLQLIKTKAVTPVVLFFDEINRTDTQTAKELMNIILTKSVNGYKFPWWVFVVSAVNPCGQDSQYAVNEFDAAQMDRFLTLQFTANQEEWTDFAMMDGINQDYIVALSTNQDIFKSGIDANENEYETSIMPTPRSHTICSYIYGSREALTMSGFFDGEEISKFDNVIKWLFEGKIGRKPAALMMKALKNKEDYIDPIEMLDGKTDHLAEKWRKKVSEMKSISLRLLTGNIIKAFSTTLVKPYFDRMSKDADVKAKATKKWDNTLAQLKEFYSLIPAALKTLFGYLTIQTSIAFDDPALIKYNKQVLFYPLASVLSQEVVDQLQTKVNLSKSGQIDQK